MNSKFDDAEATGAVEIVIDNQGCIHELRGGIDAQGRRLEVLHMTQLVAEDIEATKQHNELNLAESTRSDLNYRESNGATTS